MKYKLLKFIFVNIVAIQFLFFQTLSAQQAKINISFSEKDSVREVKVKLTTSDSSRKEIPIPKTEVHFYAKKSFGLLPLEGDNTTTDENGEASIEFPRDLPGDSLGNVTVIAKLEDNDELGSIETMKAVKWGKPVIYKTDLNQRALWASGKNAPIPLVIIVTGMIAGAWAVIIYVITLLIQIKKSGKYEIKNQV